MSRGLKLPPSAVARSGLAILTLYYLTTSEPPGSNEKSDVFISILTVLTPVPIPGDGVVASRVTMLTACVSHAGVFGLKY